MTFPRHSDTNCTPGRRLSALVRSNPTRGARTGATERVSAALTAHPARPRVVRAGFRGTCQLQPMAMNVGAILEALADGHSLREIAEHLRMSHTAVAKALDGM